jgi:hypothetical protein
MTMPDPGTTRVIGEAIERLRTDYDLALLHAGGDESMVTLYLPGEWTVLARRVCELIVSEVMRRERADLAAAAGTGPGLQACPVCLGRLWVVVYDPVTALRHVQCAGCGTASHV